VVEVRRSSDSATQDFTASQITNGQMLDFVNGGTTDLYNSARYFNGVDARVSISSYTHNTDTDVILNFTTYNLSSIGDFRLAGDSASNHIKISDSVYDVRLRLGGVNYQYGNGTRFSDFNSCELIVRRSGTSYEVILDGESLGSQTVATDLVITSFPQAGEVFEGLITTVELGSSHAYTGLGTSVTAWQDTIGSNDGTETSGAPYTGQPYDGFVPTWYDQSGNAKNATQGTTTSQPKIVDAGALVTGGLDFDGVDDGLSVSGQVLTSSSFYATSVVQHATGVSTANGQNVFGQYQVTTSGRFQLSANNSSEYSFFAHATDSIVGFGTGAIGTSQTLLSVNGDGSNAEIWRDGTSKATDTYSGFTPANVNFTIGIDSAGLREFNGKIAEVIIYNTSQSANRVGIETNINDHYSIYL
jgi:hypothetical protein